MIGMYLAEYRRVFVPLYSVMIQRDSELSGECDSNLRGNWEVYTVT